MGGRIWKRRLTAVALGGAALGAVPFVAAGAQATPIIVTITSGKQFDTEVLKRSEERLMVAFFTTSWCSKCKKVDPTARDMAKKANGRWGLAVVDADDNEALADKYNVAALPTFLFFCQRQVRSRLVDESSPAVLQERITKEENWCSKAVEPIGQTEEPTPTPTHSESKAGELVPSYTPGPEPTAAAVTPGPEPTAAAVTPGPVPTLAPGPDPAPVEPWWWYG